MTTADALYRTGDSAEAERVAFQAMGVINDLDLLVDLHWTVTQCRAMEGRSGESLEALGQALTTPTMSARQRARLLVLTARAHRDLGEVTVAGQVATEALRTAELAGDRWAIGWAQHVLIIVSMMRGDVPAALPLFERALEVVGDHPSLTDLGLLLQINQAVALGDMDRYPDREPGGQGVPNWESADQLVLSPVPLAPTSRTSWPSWTFAPAPL
jgi:hypothetical protein